VINRGSLKAPTAFGDPQDRHEDDLKLWVKLGIPQKYPPHDRPEDVLAHWV